MRRSDSKSSPDSARKRELRHVDRLACVRFCPVNLQRILLFMRSEILLTLSILNKKNGPRILDVWLIWIWFSNWVPGTLEFHGVTRASQRNLDGKDSMELQYSSLTRQASSSIFMSSIWGWYISLIGEKDFIAFRRSRKAIENKTKNSTQGTTRAKIIQW